jgi:hypothetical protein
LAFALNGPGAVVATAGRAVASVDCPPGAVTTAATGGLAEEAAVSSALGIIATEGREAGAEALESMAGTPTTAGRVEGTAKAPG